MFIAGYKISALVLDKFRLDGGAMFGSVPKTLWSKKISADAENRIQLASRILVLEGHEKKILVDVGCGTKWEEKFKKIYAIEQQFTEPLHQLVPGVTDVILTHLHFDHAGGVTYRNNVGEIALSYPDALHYLQKDNLLRAESPGIRERGSYLAENITPLRQAKLRHPADGEQILPAISVVVANGHTQAMQCVKIGQGTETLIYVADLIPTAHHVSVPYVMGYDLCAETTMREKAKVLEQAAAEGWWIVFEHDADTCMAKVQTDGKGGFAVREVGSLPELLATK